MIQTAFIGAAIFLSILIFFCLYMAYKGPSTADRVVAVNVISTKITILIVLVAVITKQDAFIDVALTYAMIGFIATISVSKYIEKGKLF